MAEKTGIAWCDSTFNPWVGCTKVSPGCDHCYAEALDKRHRWKGATHWGAGVERMRTSASNWAKPLAWNKARAKDGRRHLVFCASLADVFDNEVPQEWRTALFRLIAATQNLTWLLLTKRIGNVQKMLHTMMVDAPPLQNVWLGASVVNQEEADRDIPKLLATPAAKRFVSYEPALGPVDFRSFIPLRLKMTYHNVLDWIIVGGESAQGGAKARPFEAAWARSVIAQCKAAGVPVLMKQLGSNAKMSLGDYDRDRPINDRAGADPAEWPEDLRVQQFPT